jgi:hypothetical protein
LFISCVPMSHWPETHVNLAIRPTKAIISMLVLIPVINENKWYVNYLCPFFPFAQWTQWQSIIINFSDCAKNTAEYFISEIISGRYQICEDKTFVCLLVFNDFKIYTLDCISAKAQMKWQTAMWVCWTRWLCCLR